MNLSVVSRLIPRVGVSRGSACHRSHIIVQGGVVASQFTAVITRWSGYALFGAYRIARAGNSSTGKHSGGLYSLRKLIFQLEPRQPPRAEDICDAARFLCTQHGANGTCAGRLYMHIDQPRRDAPPAFCSEWGWTEMQSIGSATGVHDGYRSYNGAIRTGENHSWVRTSAGLIPQSLRHIR